MKIIITSINTNANIQKFYNSDNIALIDVSADSVEIKYKAIINNHVLEGEVLYPYDEIKSINLDNLTRKIIDEIKNSNTL